jgi:hypothetical protein
MSPSSAGSDLVMLKGRGAGSGAAACAHARSEPMASTSEAAGAGFIGASCRCGNVAATFPAD